LLAHLDVVEASREDWSVEPFTLLERDGYFYGRGTSDDKAMAAVFVANLIRFRQERFVPDRDIIVALTADEEGGGHHGVAWRGAVAIPGWWRGSPAPGRSSTRACARPAWPRGSRAATPPTPCRRPREQWSTVV